MPFLLLQTQTSKPSVGGFYPFQLIPGSVKSGIASEHIDIKCPCDTGTDLYSSSYFFKTDSEYPSVQSSGKLSFSVYSGTTLYADYSFKENRYDITDTTNIVRTSYVGHTDTEINAYKENYEENSCTQFLEDATIIPIAGLGKNIFVEGFSTQSIKVWLTVCYPRGEEMEDSYNSEFESKTSQWDSFSCRDCENRANYPMSAFVSVGEEWPENLIKSELVDKSPNADIPRLEKRQITSFVPIGEVSISGKVLAQYCKSNLVLQDMCIQGIPCKYPIATFGEGN